MGTIEDYKVEQHHKTKDLCYRLIIRLKDDQSAIRLLCDLTLTVNKLVDITKTADKIEYT